MRLRLGIAPSLLRLGLSALLVGGVHPLRTRLGDGLGVPPAAR